jgi:hypothetical protein
LFVAAQARAAESSRAKLDEIAQEAGSLQAFLANSQKAVDIRERYFKATKGH